MSPAPSEFESRICALLPDLERVYTDIHAHPELSMQETRTAGIAADRLRSAGFDVTSGVGKTGVVGVLRNGAGPTVMLRADMDALPVREETGLPYASTATATDNTGKTVSVMHACGHDMHVTWLVGAATVLALTREAWKGTLMPVFQPAEETGAGAQAMIDDGLMTRFPKPDAVLGQHVMVGPAGAIGGRPGVITSAADSLQIRLFGRGAHGSMPQAAIEPVVMAAATVLRLQTIVSRELAATEAAVVTIGSLQAGTKENVIPDEAVIKLNVRTFDEAMRARVLAAIERIQCRGRRVGRAQATGDHTDRPVLAGPQRSRCHTPRRRSVQILFPGRSDPRNRPDFRQRGLRVVRRSVACTVRLLVRGRYRP
jgi:amidohydrolase